MRIIRGIFLNYNILFTHFKIQIFLFMISFFHSLQFNYLLIRFFHFKTRNIDKIHLECWNAYFLLVKYDIRFLRILIINIWTILLVFQIIHPVFLNVEKSLSFSERGGFVLWNLIFLICDFTLILIPYCLILCFP